MSDMLWSFAGAMWALVVVVVGAFALAIAVSTLVGYVRIQRRKWAAKGRQSEPTLRESIRDPALLEKRLLSTAFELNLLIRAARRNNMHPQVGITTRTDPAHPDGVPQVNVRVAMREGVK